MAAPTVKKVKAVFVGDTGVGKSALLMSLSALQKGNKDQPYPCPPPPRPGPRPPHFPLFALSVDLFINYFLLRDSRVPLPPSQPRGFSCSFLPCPCPAPSALRCQVIFSLNQQYDFVKYPCYFCLFSGLRIRFGVCGRHFPLSTVDRWAPLLPFLLEKLNNP